MAKRKDVVGQVAGDNSALHSVLCLGCILNNVSTNQKTKTRGVRRTSRVCEVNGIEAMIQSPDENFILAKPPHSINHWQLFITGVSRSLNFRPRLRLEPLHKCKFRQPARDYKCKYQISILQLTGAWICHLRTPLGL